MLAPRMFGKTPTMNKDTASSNCSGHGGVSLDLD